MSMEMHFLGRTLTKSIVTPTLDTSFLSPGDFDMVFVNEGSFWTTLLGSAGVRDLLKKLSTSVLLALYEFIGNIAIFSSSLNLFSTMQGLFLP